MLTERRLRRCCKWALIRNIHKKYPEVILMDSTYKTNNLRMPLFFILAIDGNGESIVVAMFLVTSEEQHVLNAMLRIFKEQNPTWPKTEVALTDKDMVERKTLL